MRRSNWKIKAWFIVSAAIGIIAGIFAAYAAQKYYPAAAGTAFFGGMMLVIILMVLFGVKILRIGE
ncbi:hypothetical protein [Mediterraneibacter agrestimuris]|uniref:hypothetical protein n=1 Tax=Mediterraneibacter agrestimuris TaxID=2941333 RepID=UPI00203E8695|nr:hypothetical protein [Mediterraneibacter agrestimuris]